MQIYTSRFSNPELKKGTYTAVRISLGAPRWKVGYEIHGEMKELMPFGLMNKYDEYEDFKREYFSRLDGIGPGRIRALLEYFARSGQDVVLLCFEDVRKGPQEWCHRIAFSEWWLLNTGEAINELLDPSPVAQKTSTSPPKPDSGGSHTKPQTEQLKLFEGL